MDRRDFIRTGACLSLAIAAKPAFAIVEKLGGPSHQPSEFEKLFHLDNIRIIRVDNWRRSKWVQEIYYMFKDGTKVTEAQKKAIRVTWWRHNQAENGWDLNELGWWDTAVRVYDPEDVKRVMTEMGWHYEAHAWQPPKPSKPSTKPEPDHLEPWYNEVMTGCSEDSCGGVHRKKEIA